MKKINIKIESDFIYIKSRMSIMSVIVMQLIFFIFYFIVSIFLYYIFNNAIVLLLLFLIYIVMCVFFVFNKKEASDEIALVINKKKNTIDVSEGNGDWNQKYLGKFREINIESYSSRAIEVILYCDKSKYVLLRDTYWSTEFTVELEKKFTPVAKNLNIPITNSFTNRR